MWTWRKLTELMQLNGRRCGRRRRNHKRLERGGTENGDDRSMIRPACACSALPPHAPPCPFMLRHAPSCSPNVSARHTRGSFLIIPSHFPPPLPDPYWSFMIRDRFLSSCVCPLPATPDPSCDAVHLHAPPCSPQFDIDPYGTLVFLHEPICSCQFRIAHVCACMPLFVAVAPLLLLPDRV